MSFGNACHGDPRTRLAREKYFSIRPRPLERWLWSQGIPASAERVFWLHWQEGMQRGDWCSEIPLRRVARECNLDASTVTRAYQLLIRMGCLRRTDPGRDPANPFQQATAVTEVRLPPELLREMPAYPNRRPRAGDSSPAEATSAQTPKPTSPSTQTSTSPATAAEEGIAPPDPLAHLGGRERAQHLAQLTHTMSPSERHAFQEAIRLHQPGMSFDSQTSVPRETQAAVLAVLASLANAPHATTPGQAARPRTAARRNLSVFELARLRRGIQSVTSSPAAAPDLFRQVVWAIEAGSLKRFAPLHALNIALKKIREGAWTRPHRMPPNWARSLSASPPHEACGAA